MRKISYANAINEGFTLAMRKDKRIFQIGVGINTPWYVGNTMNGLLDEFGQSRMIDTPVSENGVTGIAIGAAISGLKPILTFARMDFMYYAMDQICNHAASLNYSLGGNSPVPILIRAIINRKGEQAAQHSQALHGLLMHIPGLKIIMPSTPYDAKGMILSALEENSPIIYIDDRELYNEEGVVLDDEYLVPLNSALVVKEGKDISVISSSKLLSQVKESEKTLSSAGIDVEIIDLRVIKPLDSHTIINSVKKTGRLAIVDGGWYTGGVASEVISIIATAKDITLKTPPLKICLPDLPAPASILLEKEYYPDSLKIVNTIQDFILSRN